MALVVTGCPLRLLDAGTEQTLLAAELAEKGTWPVAGGWLDQSRIGVEAVRLVWSLKDRWKAELMKKANE